MFAENQCSCKQGMRPFGFISSKALIRNGGFTNFVSVQKNMVTP